MTKQDILRLYDVDQEQVSTRCRIHFTAPQNVIDEPVVCFGKLDEAENVQQMYCYKCVDFQGTYETENIYLNLLCQYLTNFWQEVFLEFVQFKYDIVRVSKTLKARIYCVQQIIEIIDGEEIPREINVPFAFGTNDYKLQKILGYKTYDQDQIYKTSAMNIKEIQKDGKIQSQERLIIQFQRKMFINYIKYLNIVCHGIVQFTHRENNVEQYILLRQMYNVAGMAYVEMSSNDYVTFQTNTLAGNGIQIYFQDENYHQIDLEDEPYILELFIEPSQQMLEKRAIMEQNQQKRIEEEQQRLMEEEQQKQLQKEQEEQQKIQEAQQKAQQKQQENELKRKRDEAQVEANRKLNEKVEDKKFYESLFKQLFDQIDSLSSSVNNVNTVNQAQTSQAWLQIQAQYIEQLEVQKQQMNEQMNVFTELRKQEQQNLLQVIQQQIEQVQQNALNQAQTSQAWLQQNAIQLIAQMNEQQMNQQAQTSQAWLQQVAVNQAQTSQAWLQGGMEQLLQQLQEQYNQTMNNLTTQFQGQQTQNNLVLQNEFSKLLQSQYKVPKKTKIYNTFQKIEQKIIQFKELENTIPIANKLYENFEQNEQEIQQLKEVLQNNKIQVQDEQNNVIEKELKEEDKLQINRMLEQKLEKTKDLNEDINNLDEQIDQSINSYQSSINCWPEKDTMSINAISTQSQSQNSQSQLNNNPSSSIVHNEQPLMSDSIYNFNVNDYNNLPEMF